MIKIELKVAEAEALQYAVEHHMYLCNMQLYEEYDGLNQEEIEEIENFEPYDAYCGCDTCVTREYLMKTFDFLRFMSKVDIYTKDE